MKNKPSRKGEQSLPTISVGIDVASQKFDVFLMNKEEEGTHHTFKNNKRGISQFISLLASFSGKVVMESTGRYSELLAVTLFSKRFDTYLINPLRIKKYQQAGIQKTKTDKIDAMILAEMGIKEKKLDKFTLTHEQMGIKKKIALLRSLEKKLQELKAMITNYKASQEKLGITLSQIETEIQASIKKIEYYKKKLEQEVIAAVFPEGNERASSAHEILTGIPGVSSYYASIVYFHYRFLPGRSVKSWIAYSGLAVTTHESGKWVGKGKLSKRGNKYLRKRNYTAAWGAYMHNPEYKAYYEYLKNVKGRSHTEALIIVGKKILRTAYYCLKENKVYDHEIFKKTLIKQSILKKAA